MEQVQNTAGIEAILAALANGGQPVGNLGKQPVGINPAMIPAGAIPPQEGAVAGQPSPNPAAQAVGVVQPNMEAILQALLAQGAFNAEGQPNVG